MALSTFYYMEECVYSRNFWADSVGYLREKCDKCARLVVNPTHSIRPQWQDGYRFCFILLKAKFSV